MAYLSFLMGPTKVVSFSFAHPLLIVVMGVRTCKSCAIGAETANPNVDIIDLAVPVLHHRTADFTEQ